MLIIAEEFLNLPGYTAFWLLFFAAAALFTVRVRFLVRLLKLGRPENRFDRPAYRWLRALAVTFTQSSNLKSATLKDPAAVGHALMFWGLGVFLVYYVVFTGLGAGFGLSAIMGGSSFERAFSSIADIAAALVIAGIIWAFIKRYLIRPERLKAEQTTGEKVLQPLVLTVIALLMVLYYLIEGFGYAAHGTEANWPPVGSSLAGLLSGADISQAGLETVYRSLWWLNYVLLLAALVYAPRSSHLHPLFSIPNLAYKNLASKGALRNVDLDRPETFSITKVRDFTWKQLLDLYACTQCGRCHEVCPARASGKPLSPRELILNLKKHFIKSGPEELRAKNGAGQGVAVTEAGLIGQAVTEDEVWACTTCRACQEVCPVSNEHVDKIVDIRRSLIMVSQSETARDTLKNLRVRGHPWRGTLLARTDWAEDVDIRIAGEDQDFEVLFWVGCTEALEDRSLRVAQSCARLMKQSGISFAILGEEEMCCGEPARRLGAEHLFQMLAMNNIQVLQSYNVRKIVTACPHCFNTLKNEYPRFGGNFEVVHHTRFILDLVRENKLHIKNERQDIITYQDPCYLGRYNDIYQTSRQIIGGIPGITLAEMKQNREESFCCGGGGGRMWLEEKTGQRINEMRLDQALDTRAQVVATACPFCLQMLEDAARSKEVTESVRIMDIAELVDESLEK